MNVPVHWLLDKLGLLAAEAVGVVLPAEWKALPMDLEALDFFVFPVMMVSEYLPALRFGAMWALPVVMCIAEIAVTVFCMLPALCRAPETEWEIVAVSPAALPRLLLASPDFPLFAGVMSGVLYAGRRGAVRWLSAFPAFFF